MVIQLYLEQQKQILYGYLLLVNKQWGLCPQTFGTTYFTPALNIACKINYANAILWGSQETGVWVTAVYWNLNIINSNVTISHNASLDKYNVFYFCIGTV